MIYVPTYLVFKLLHLVRMVQQQTTLYGYICSLFDIKYYKKWLLEIALESEAI